MVDIKKNEFEELSCDDDQAPEQKFSEGIGQDELISGGSAGTVYDWSQAPEGVKAPPRKDLNGKVVTIKKADVVLPPLSTPWLKTRDGTKDYKYCTFALFYDVDGQQEFYSGVRVFKRDDGKYSHPSITKDRVNQASALMGLYADFKSKDINEVSLREFLAFLNGKPKAVIKSAEFPNPKTKTIVKKNLVEKFVA